MNKKRSDLEHLDKILDGVEQASEALSRISKQARKILDSPKEREVANRYASLSEEELREWRADSPQEFVESEWRLEDNSASLLWFLRRKCEDLKLQIEADGIDLRVDWRACATANLAKVVWEQRLRKEAPKAIHADAPGPFGRFLDEVLETIYDGYDLGGVPSARSAMRALNNVTNSGAIPIGNW